MEWTCARKGRLENVAGWEDEEGSTSCDEPAASDLISGIQQPLQSPAPLLFYPDFETQQEISMRHQPTSGPQPLSCRCSAIHNPLSSTVQRDTILHSWHLRPRPREPRICHIGRVPLKCQHCSFTTPNEPRSSPGRRMHNG